jgi:hypothetical protein
VTVGVPAPTGGGEMKDIKRRLAIIERILLNQGGTIELDHFRVIGDYTWTQQDDSDPIVWTSIFMEGAALAGGGRVIPDRPGLWFLLCTWTYFSNDFSETALMIRQLGSTPSDPDTQFFYTDETLRPTVDDQAGSFRAAGNTGGLMGGLPAMGWRPVFSRADGAATDGGWALDFSGVRIGEYKRGYFYVPG